MVWRPEPGGPRNLRELYHWVWGQLTSAGELIDSGGGGAGEANTSSNSGTGAGLAQAKSGVDLPFKTILATGATTITEQANTITIDSTAAGGGVPEAPVDGRQYGREDATWTPVLDSVIQGRWLWNDVLTGDPGIGYMGSQNGQLAGVTELRFNPTTADGEGIPPDALYQPGDVIYIIDEDRAAFGRFSVVSVVDNTTHKTFNVIEEVGQGNPQTDNVMDVAYLPQASSGGGGGGLVKIETIENITAGNFFFDNISQIYDRLYIKGYLRSTLTGLTYERPHMLLNEDAVVSNYFTQSAGGNNGSAFGNEVALPRIGFVPSNSAVANSHAPVAITLENYAGANLKDWISTSGNYRTGGTESLIETVYTSHDTMTAAVTQIRIQSETDSTTELVGKLTLYGEN